VADNVARLREISGLDEVSFHMSGTEAVMQAVRLARYHTGRRHLVRFTGAYHGWWEDVQPGPGNPLPPRETYTLKDMDERALQVLRTRKDIACVLVNPLQALHPNRNAPGDSTLVDGSRSARYDRAAYTAWLQRLREVCSERGIVLILDEVFVGFRLAPGGAQEYFGVRADLVTYGKTLGGGFPVGVVCGKAELMRRFKPERPADLCFARGTFNAHPYVMGAMQAFLQRIRTPEIKALYEGLDERWTARAAAFNQALQDVGHPVRIEPVQHLDRQLHPALALPLDAAVLPARAGPGVELGRNRAPDLQPQLLRYRHGRGPPALPARLRAHAAGRLVVARPRTDPWGDSPARAARDAATAPGFLRLDAASLCVNRSRR